MIQNNWIIYRNLNEILNHSNRELVNISEESSDFKLIHIHHGYLTDKKLICLIEIEQNNSINYLLIFNETIINDMTEDQVNPIVSTITSKIVGLITLNEIYNYFSNNEMKIYGLQELFGKKNNKLSDKYNKKISTDFSIKIGRTPNDIRKNTLIKYIKSCERLTLIEDTNKNLLKLINSIIITDEMLDINYKTLINKMILDKMMRIGENSYELLWMKNFSNLEWLELTEMNWFTIDHIKSIVKYLYNLSVLNIHGVGLYNIKILYEILKLKNIEKIVINDPDLKCEHSSYELCVNPEEWEEVKNYSVKQLVINTVNMRLDILLSLFESLPNLELLIVHNEAFNEIVRKGSYVQDSPNKLRIGSWDMIDNGGHAQKFIQVTKPLRFNGVTLLKGNYKLSESLRKKIELTNE